MYGFVDGLLDILSTGLKSEEELYREINYLVDHRDRYRDDEFKQEICKLWTLYNMKVRNRK